MKKIFSFLAAVLFAGSMMASVGNLYYTLEISKTAVDAGGNTSYDGSAEMTVGGMTWSLSGNTNLGDFWAVGGKSLTSKERATYSQTAMGDAIAKIVVSHSGTTSDALLVDSVVLTVASDKDFNNVIDRKKENPTISKNVAGTIEFLAAESWAKDAYYKVSFFLTNAKNSNYRLPINKIDFYSYQSATAPAINAEKIALGLIPTTTLPYEKTVELAVVGANLSDAITYSVLGENTTVTGTLTAEGGTLNVKFAAAAEGEYSDTIVLTSGATTTKVAVEAKIVKTTGDGTKANPFNVADVVKLNNEYSAEKYWVVGYIVGCAANNGLIAESNVASNIALGDAADQTENVIPVELPSGDIRTALNLVDNTTNKGKKVKVFGQLVSYFTYFGVKAISEFEFVEETVEHTYTVAGDSEAAFGKAWDPTYDANDMVKQADGSYKWEKENITLGAGTVAFKVCEDHAWAVAYPAGNYELAIAEAGIYTVTITYEPASENKVSAVATKTGSAVVIPTIAMHGNFTGSWKDTELFTLAADEKTATLALTLTAGNYEFGMRIGGAGNWTSNGAAFTRADFSHVIVAGSGNLTLAADVDGEYIFTWTYETNILDVTYPAAPVEETKYCEFPTGHLKDANFGDVNGRILLTIAKGEGNNIIVKVKNNNANGNTKTGLNYLWVSAEGATSAKVVYGDGTHTEADVEEVSVVVPFDAAKESYNFSSIHWAYSGWDGEWAIDGLVVKASELCEEGIGTAIDNTEVAEKAVKMIENGQLFIIKNGVKYNAQGVVVK
ncbi:MAG: hypothetical protein J5902_03375 [Paludibacteraceae bacterium]|nr:hypothetical protein [Paludibacteraceae bacterium]